MATVIDGRINLTAVCRAAEYHHLTCIERLVRLGVARRQAEAFVQYAGAERDRNITAKNERRHGGATSIQTLLREGKIWGMGERISDSEVDDIDVAALVA